jgi:hypothetical protein
MYYIRDTIIELLRTYPFTDVNIILLAIILAVIGNIAIYLIYVKIVIPKLKTSFENNSKNNI